MSRPPAAGSGGEHRRRRGGRAEAAGRGPARPSRRLPGLLTCVACTWGPAIAPRAAGPAAARAFAANPRLQARAAAAAAVCDDPGTGGRRGGRASEGAAGAQQPGEVPMQRAGRLFRPLAVNPNAALQASPSGASMAAAGPPARLFAALERRWCSLQAQGVLW